MVKSILTVFLLLILIYSPSAFAASPPAEHSEQTMQVTVFVPADLKKYNELINEADFDTAAGLLFAAKKINVPYDRDMIRASADAAAKQMPCQGGPAIFYLKVINRTAYVLLNIDRDGFAGVSYALARSHPVVEKTLLQFKTIDHVVWNEAPGDTPRFPE